MKFAGYDHRVRAKVPCCGTKQAEFGVIVAGRYTLHGLNEQLSVVSACVCMTAD
jgi:hypothetical protein